VTPVGYPGVGYVTDLRRTCDRLRTVRSLIWTRPSRRSPSSFFPVSQCLQSRRIHHPRPLSNDAPSAHVRAPGSTADQGVRCAGLCLLGAAPCSIPLRRNVRWERSKREASTPREARYRRRRRSPPGSSNAYREPLRPTHAYSISSTTPCRLSTQNISSQRASRTLERTHASNSCETVGRRGVRRIVRCPHGPAHSAGSHSRLLDDLTGRRCSPNSASGALEAPTDTSVALADIPKRECAGGLVGKLWALFRNRTCDLRLARTDTAFSEGAGHASRNAPLTRGNSGP
jgi:hypothetical protein